MKKPYVMADWTVRAFPENLSDFIICAGGHHPDMGPVSYGEDIEDVEANGPGQIVVEHGEA